ncbi:uncharacterized protein LOC108624414 isoform X2 [Ceratina calcarata]|uniref:Uncharacterized protein LOC108624414 isoform X2 n=1 Tax=Ceratina calcarata TaxID=156304 RepID=A0AAJ7N5X6_9HYME|nr:uncharacterized protein LOC108624414 isoform X2 [Ceratina calcarata]
MYNDNVRASVRHRKSETKFNESQMLESCSDEGIRSSIRDVIAVMKSEEDTESEDEKDYKRQLIPTNSQISEDVIVRRFEDENVWSISVQMFVPFLLAGFGMVAASLLLDVVQVRGAGTENLPNETYRRARGMIYSLALASVSDGLRGLYTGSCVARFKRELGNDVSLQILDSCESRTHGHEETTMDLGRWKSRTDTVSSDGGRLACFPGRRRTRLDTGSSVRYESRALIMRQCLVHRVRGKLSPELGIASLLFRATEYAPWIAPTLIVFHVTITPIWAYIAARNPFTREILDYGWAPVICAMLISSVGGLILDYTISNYKGIAVFQLVINGVGGNLAAVQASRISTSLHRDHRSNNEGSLPVVRFDPSYTFCTKGGHARTARVLLMMVIPGHLIFGYTISYLQAGHTSLTPIFLSFYLLAALLQVTLLLYITQLMVIWMWRRGMDPDNSAIPYLTAAGDLIGTVLLGIAFHILYAIGDKDSDVGD